MSSFFGGGGGSGFTVNETFELGDLTGGTSEIITHGSVAMDNYKINFTGYITKEGSTAQTSSFTDKLSDPTAWEYKDILNGNTSFIFQGAYGGKFPTSPSSEVNIGTTLRLSGGSLPDGGVSFLITDFVGDGTGDNSVTFDLGATVGTYDIDFATNIKFDNGYIEASGSSGTYVKNVWSYAYLKNIASFDFTVVETFNAIGSSYGVLPATTTFKAAFSKDNGSTWYYHNGTNWTTMLLSEFNTKGCLAVANNWQASDTTVLDNEILDAFGFGDPTSQVKAALAVTLTADDSSYLGNFQVYYDNKDEVMTLTNNDITIPQYGGGQQLLVTRVNATTARVKNSSFSTTFKDVVINVTAW